MARWLKKKGSKRAKDTDTNYHDPYWNRGAIKYGRNYIMAYEVKEKKAVLFSDPAVELIGAGETLVNGKKTYITVLKKFDRQGLPFYEALVGIGRLHYNAPENKSNPASPDIGGLINIDGEPLRFGGWAKTASNGNSYISMNLDSPSASQQEASREDSAD